MFNLLIVDDNPVDRRALENRIDWNDLGVQVVGSLTNGKKALNKIAELGESGQDVDIIITDVAMPVMNGIVMAKAIKAKYPHVQIIFMSCHDDFEYAKSAIDINAYGYILKPIKINDLTNVMMKLLHEIKEKRSFLIEKELAMKQIKLMLPMVREQFLRELMLGKADNIENNMDFLELSFPADRDIYVVSIQLCPSESFDEKKIEDQYLVSYMIMQCIQNIMNKWIGVFSVQITRTDFAALIFIDAQHDLLEAIIAMYSCITEKINTGVIVGVSNKSRVITDISKLYAQSSYTVKTNFFSVDPIIFYNEIEENHYMLFEREINLESLYSEIKAILNDESGNDIQKLLDRYISPDNALLPEYYIKSLTVSIVNMTAIILLDEGHSFADVFSDETLVWNKISKYETILNVKQWIYNFLHMIVLYLNAKNESQDVRIINSIKQIIEEKYPQNITVEDISKAVHLCSRQANVIFKRAMGKTIFDYLLEYRMETAKKLLLKPDSKITVISGSVGYENNSFFSLMFKKYEGITPSEYKNRNSKYNRLNQE